MGNGEVKEREGDMMVASVGDTSHIAGPVRIDNGVNGNRGEVVLSSDGRKIVRSGDFVAAAAADGFNFMLGSCSVCICFQDFFTGDCNGDF